MANGFLSVVKYMHGLKNKILIVILLFFLAVTTITFAKQVQVSVSVPGWYELKKDNISLYIWTNMAVWVNGTQVK